MTYFFFPTVFSNFAETGKKWARIKKTSPNRFRSNTAQPQITHRTMKCHIRHSGPACFRISTRKNTDLRSSSNYRHLKILCTCELSNLISFINCAELVLSPVHKNTDLDSAMYMHATILYEAKNLMEMSRMVHSSHLSIHLPPQLSVISDNSFSEL